MIKENERFIIIENESISLTIGKDGKVYSLKYIPSNEELLCDTKTSMFTVTQERFFDNELKLIYPSRRINIPSDRIRIENGRLVAGFSPLCYEALIKVEDKKDYFVFSFKGFVVPENAYPGLSLERPPATEFRFLQLSLREKKYFGEWMNVLHDDNTAVCLMGTSAHIRVGNEKTDEGRLLFTDAVKGIKFKGSSAALFVSSADTLLDKVSLFEEEYSLPLGVKSRRHDKINASSYWICEPTPDNIDEHIAYALKGGFRMMLLYYPGIVKEENGYSLCGNYELREEYKNGLSDVKALTDKIKAHGITPGFHFLHSHIGLRSRYFTPKADRRVMHRQYLTLSHEVKENDSVIYTDQSPYETDLPENCRLLRFGTELIKYDTCTDTYPYCYKGCIRGYNGTKAQCHPEGTAGGVIFVSEFGATSGYCDQNSSLQDEIAEKIARIYDCGFEYIYFDGSEGVNAPYDYQIPMAQYRVYSKLSKKPVYCEAAAKGHFSWHILSGGNAFDVFPTDIFKRMIDKYPLSEAANMKMDFTRLNFGWWGFFADTRPDVYEYGTSHAAGFDCPVTVQSHIENMKKNHGTDDILEVMRRWEDVRKRKLLTLQQKELLQMPGREFILLLNKDGEYELTEYYELKTKEKDMTVFTFERNGKNCAVLYCNTGEGRLLLKNIGEFTYRDEADGNVIPTCKSADSYILPVGRRKYLETSLSRSELRNVLINAELL
ncbi:MAG: hypothetical protein E7573_03540 [Ruminococcaceae bacterium]|nr:hypothetical protein [Oscillospiraceae bacterium]